MKDRTVLDEILEADGLKHVTVGAWFEGNLYFASFDMPRSMTATLEIVAIQDASIPWRRFFRLPPHRRLEGRVALDRHDLTMRVIISGIRVRRDHQPLFPRGGIPF